ncbi:MAG: 4-alpha-glucanotransferase [Bacteroidetes bacterium ADurb.Bin408]|nr:MAG: 4-alpha-glucanotransferase [Bacteroidetes bacterium ADurb.Bin408]
MKKYIRKSGILLHISSLPGKFGIGTFGKNAYQFIDFLAEAGQKIWQILPLGHTGFGDSPYQCYSAFAGNPLFIDLELLVEAHLLSTSDISKQISFAENEFDTAKTRNFVMPLFKRAAQNFHKSKTSETELFAKFCRRQSFWLDDYALFIALKKHFDDRPWYAWDSAFRLRDKQVLEKAITELTDEINFQKTIQYFFFRQWMQLKSYAHEKGVKIMGDIPLYVSYDSADAWAHPEIFMFDDDKKPIAVAGVPPDYFSETGQLWGNPLYNWEYLKSTGFKWWIDRIKANFELYDILRIDHFRGLSAFWSVPFGEETAIKGEWVPAPGMALFETLLKEMGPIPIVAEDLGVITDDVELLRDSFNFPGMKILQFAFDSSEDNEFLPHTFTRHCIVYTGTHDNDTTVGWYATASDEDKAFMHSYFNFKPENVHWELIRLAWSSVAETAIAPMQDVLGLGTEHRMNLPGKPTGYWKWRLNKAMLTSEVTEKLKKITEIYSR